MSYPKTYRAWRRSAKPYPLKLVLSTETLPDELGANDVLIRIHAVSLNYRDAAMLEEGKYPVPVDEEGISGSDSAAEVVAIGPSVTKFTVGDHVAVAGDLLRLSIDDREMETIAIGGEGTGTLQEYAVFEEKVLVKLPMHLSWEEASTVPGCGVTVWNSFDALRKVPKGATALMQGTGGVSIMAVLICVAAGIRPIVTSSSDEKIAKLKEISPTIEGINYKTSDVKARTLELTDGKGVDFLINNVGLSSLPEDLELIRKTGIIAFLGFLGGFEADFDPKLIFTVLLKACRIQGILGGSRDELQAVCDYMGEKKVGLQPIIDKIFNFDEAPQAFEYLAAGKHVGKVVIRLS